MDNEKILEEIDKMHHLANESLSQKKSIPILTSFQPI